MENIYSVASNNISSCTGIKLFSSRKVAANKENLEIKALVIKSVRT